MREQSFSSEVSLHWIAPSHLSSRLKGNIRSNYRKINGKLFSPWYKIRHHSWTGPGCRRWGWGWCCSWTLRRRSSAWSHWRSARSDGQCPGSHPAPYLRPETPGSWYSSPSRWRTVCRTKYKLSPLRYTEIGPQCVTRKIGFLKKIFQV